MPDDGEPDISIEDGLVEPGESGSFEAVENLSGLPEGLDDRAQAELDKQSHDEELRGAIISGEIDRQTLVAELNARYGEPGSGSQWKEIQPDRPDATIKFDRERGVMETYAGDAKILDSQTVIENGGEFAAEQRATIDELQNHGISFSEYHDLGQGMLYATAQGLNGETVESVYYARELTEEELAIFGTDVPSAEDSLDDAFDDDNVSATAIADFEPNLQDGEIVLEIDFAAAFAEPGNLEQAGLWTMEPAVEQFAVPEARTGDSPQSNSYVEITAGQPKAAAVDAVGISVAHRPEAFAGGQTFKEAPLIYTEARAVSQAVENHSSENHFESAGIRVEGVGAMENIMTSKREAAKKTVNAQTAPLSVEFRGIITEAEALELREAVDSNLGEQTDSATSAITIVKTASRETMAKPDAGEKEIMSGSPVEPIPNSPDVIIIEASQNHEAAHAELQAPEIAEPVQAVVKVKTETQNIGLGKGMEEPVHREALAENTEELINGNEVIIEEAREEEESNAGTGIQLREVKTVETDFILEEELGEDIEEKATEAPAVNNIKVATAKTTAKDISGQERTVAAETGRQTVRHGEVVRFPQRGNGIELTRPARIAQSAEQARPAAATTEKATAKTANVVYPNFRAGRAARTQRITRAAETLSQRSILSRSPVPAEIIDNSAASALEPLPGAGISIRTLETINERVAA